MKTRMIRKSILPIMAILVACGIPPHCMAQTNVTDEAGDPGKGLEREILPVNDAFVKSLVEKKSKFPIPVAQRRAVLLQMLHIAERYADKKVSRKTDRDQVTRFCRLYGLPFVQNGSYIRYCAAGVSYAACQAVVDTQHLKQDKRNDPIYLRTILPTVRENLFYPYARCQDILDKAKTHHAYIPKSDYKKAKPGYLVLFKWNARAKRAQHIGIVRSGDPHDATPLVYVPGKGRPAQIGTVEFNTQRPGGPGTQSDGGAVYYTKHRSLANIVGFVRTY